MSVLNAGKITEYASLSGFAPGEVEIATAIALAESRGDTNAHNSTPPDDSYGLWQINMIGDLGTRRRKQFGISKNTELFDPAVNGRAAHMVYKESGWKAWTTYTNQEYKKYMDTVQNGSIPGVVNDVKDSTSGALSGIASSVNTVGRNLFNAVSNVAALTFAAVILIAGIIILTRNVVPINRLRKSVTRGVKKS